MRSILFNLMILIGVNVYSQNSPLEDHIWQLEKIVTTDSILTVPSYITFTANFQDQSYYSMGSCNPIVGNLNYINQNSSFTITLFGVPIEPCDQEDFEAEMIDVFFQEEFLFDIPYTTTLSPFVYDFYTENDKIYLNISNTEGNFALFYHNLLSQNSFEEQKINIYPNPVSDLLTIEADNFQIKGIKIFDLKGQLLNMLEGLNINTIDVSELSQGLYVLHFYSDSGAIKKKFLKK